MQLIVNGKQELIEESKTLEELLNELGYERNSVAVAQDGSFVPKQEYAKLALKDGMELEVLVPMQGG